MSSDKASEAMSIGRAQEMRERRDCQAGIEHDAGAGENSEYDPPADFEELVQEVIDLRDRLAAAEETIDYLEREISSITEVLNMHGLEA